MTISSQHSAIELVQLTDPHLHADAYATMLGVDTDYTFRSTVEKIMVDELDIDLVLVTGDIAQDGSVAAYKRFLDIADSLNAPLRTLPGNHDDQANFRAVLSATADPVIDLGAWRIIMLDSTVAGSNGGRLAQEQLDLLGSAAGSAADRHVLVAMHHNPVEVGSPWLDTMMIENGPALFDAINGLPQVRAVLWGHVHQEFDCLRERPGYDHAKNMPPVRLLATPSTCIQFAPHSETFMLDQKAPAYRWLRLHPDGTLETGVRRVTGLDIRVDTTSRGY